MDTKEKRIRAVTWAAFIIYLLTLIWVVVFKTQIAYISFSWPNYRLPINFIPFGASVISDGRIYLPEIFENVIAFVPLGLFVSIFAKKGGVWKAALWGFGTSLLFETVQYVFAIGSADITDVITNTTGAVLGALLWLLLRGLFKKKTEAVTSITLLAAELLFIGFFGFLTLVN